MAYKKLLDNWKNTLTALRRGHCPPSETYYTGYPADMLASAGIDYPVLLVEDRDSAAESRWVGDGRMQPLGLI